MANYKSESTKKRGLHEPIILALIAGTRYSVVARAHGLHVDSVRAIYKKNLKRIEEGRAKYLEEVELQWKTAMENEVKSQTDLLEDSSELLRHQVEQLKAHINTLKPGTPEFMENLQVVLKIHQQIRTQLFQGGRVATNG